MSTSQPPELPNEVWRDNVPLPAFANGILFAITDTRGEYVVWRWVRGLRWEAAHWIEEDYALFVAAAYRAFARRERARAEAWKHKADAAERIARFAPGASDLHPHDIDTVAEARADLDKADAELRALGEDP